MSCKTPVSILQELCTRSNLFPQYDLIVNGVGTHDPIFKYRLQCGNIISFGTGKSKKEAKHDAARDALSQMKSNSENELIIEKDQVEDIADVVKDITLPYNDILKENTIGALSALCSANKLPEPEYFLIGEEGPPHSKQFTFQCKVSHMVEQAMSRTKKQARHKSAKLMIEKLKVSFNSTLNFQSLEEDNNNNKESDDENDRVKEKYTDMQKKLKRPTENFGLRLSEYHLVGKNDAFFVNNSGFNKLKENDISWVSNCEDPISILDEIIGDSEVEYIFSEVPLCKQSNIICFSFTLHSSPSWLVFGTGKTADEAKHNSLIKMLIFLKNLIS